MTNITSSAWISSVLLLSIYTGCQAPHYTMENLPNRQLIFGQGGGITGEVKKFILLENGQLFTTSSLTKEQKELPPLSAKQGKEIFGDLRDLSLNEIDFNHPGNLYYFLEEKNHEQHHRVTWGDPNHQVPKKISTFYHQLKTLQKTN